MKCRCRCFYSQGAFLVLLWVALLSATSWSLIREYPILFRGLPRPYYYVALTPIIPLLVAAPLSGWFADVCYGNFKVFKAGLLLTLSAAILSCICILVLSNVSGSNNVTEGLSGGVSLLVYALALVGILTCFVTALQLGLDQMPDASAANVGSFISWFVVAIFGGFWVADSLFVIAQNCYESVSYRNMQLYSIFPPICMCLVCFSLFLVAPKWLIIEPTCPQSLRIIYHVLRFAAKYKTPLNRSALTYWEENIPSRLDLGKSRYGGPFTTEQVEDVKTFFKISVIFIPVFITLITLRPKLIPKFGTCGSGILFTFTYSPWQWSTLAAIALEIVVYNPFKNKLPSILKCIGFALLLVLLAYASYLVVTIVDHYHPLHLGNWPLCVSYVLFGAIIQFMLTRVLEFVCAQAPYSMRGLLAGYTIFLFVSSIGVGAAIFRLLDSEVLCNANVCPMVQISLACLLSLIGLLSHCVLAYWYKMRVRDEQYDVHRVVEEVYDRYLSQESRHV